MEQSICNTSILGVLFLMSNIKINNISDDILNNLMLAIFNSKLGEITIQNQT